MSSVRDYERYHGIVLTKMVSATTRPISIAPYDSEDKASYVLDGRLGLYIKYSSKRLTPWGFSFQAPHQEEIKRLKTEYGNVCVAFVCGLDGVALLTHAELKEALDEQFDPVEWISITRKRGGMYSVHGTNGKLRFRIGQSEFPKKIFESLHDQSATNSVST